MKKAAICISYLIVVCCYKGIAQTPANDEYANALEIIPAAFGYSCSTPARISTAGATQSPVNPTCTGTENNDDVWYKFTATSETVLFRFDSVINNSSGARGTVGFAVYRGNTSSPDSSIYCNNLGSAGTPYKIVNGFETGTMYMIRFWSTLAGSNSIRFDFCLLAVPPSGNDDCSAAIPISTLPLGSTCTVFTEVNTTGATASEFGPDCASTFIDDDVWYSFVAQTNGVSLSFTDAESTTFPNRRGNIGYALYSACPSDATALQCKNNIGAGSGTELIGDLIPGNTYYLRLYSYDVQQYVRFNLCLTDIELVENDECNSAIELSVSNGIFTAPLKGDLLLATASAGFNAPSCAPLYPSKDIWYSAVVPPSGSLIIEVNKIWSEYNSFALELYEGTCDALQRIDCTVEGNPSPDNQQFPALTIQGRQAGERLYIRVISVMAVNSGFTICARDPSYTVSISTGGDCISSSPLIIDSVTNKLFRWVPLLDASGKRIADIYSPGNVLGETIASLYVSPDDSIRFYSGKPYLSRNLTLQTQFPGTAYIRLYFEAEEFSQLSAIDPAIQAVSDLGLTETPQTCSDAFQGPGTGIMPLRTGDYETGHYIEFELEQPGTLFIHGAGYALPLVFYDVQLKVTGEDYLLQWTVKPDPDLSNCIVEESLDGQNFNLLADIPAHAFFMQTGEALQYSYTGKGFSGARYFRILLQGRNGTTVFSKTLFLNMKIDDQEMRIYPNPVAGQLNIYRKNATAPVRIEILNLEGLLVKQLEAAGGSEQIRIDTTDLSKGIYLIRVISHHNGLQQHFKCLKL